MFYSGMKLSGREYTGLIDNVPVSVTMEDSLRDGGTVYLKLATGQTIHYPAPRFDPNPVPTPIFAKGGL